MKVCDFVNNMKNVTINNNNVIATIHKLIKYDQTKDPSSFIEFYYLRTEDCICNECLVSSMCNIDKYSCSLFITNLKNKGDKFYE